MANPFDKLKETSDVSVPLQKIVPVRKNKRDFERSYTLWLNKDLLHQLKLRAVQTDDNVKNIVEAAILNYLKK